MSYGSRAGYGYGGQSRRSSGRRGFNSGKSHKSESMSSQTKAVDVRKQHPFLGTCDRFRQTPEGENQWQIMMQTKKPISEREFLKRVDVSEILDEGETWADYKENAIRENSPLEFYESSNGLIFFQTAGFEFIWRL